MIFLIILVLAYVLWSTLTSSMLNPYKLIMVFGKKGSGKTTFLTKQAIRHLKKGWKVYSNIYIPGTYLFNTDDIGRYQFAVNSLIIIDEVGMIWDNRQFREFKTDVRDWFKLQRQYRNKVIMTSQAFDIDKKLRDLTDEMYLITNFLRAWSICKFINKKTVIANNENGNGKEGGTLTEFYWFSLIPSFTFIPRWTPFFNSFNPKPLMIKDYEYQGLNDEQNKLMSSKYYWITSIKFIAIRFKNYIIIKINYYLNLLKQLYIKLISKFRKNKN